MCSSTWVTFQYSAEQKNTLYIFENVSADFRCMVWQSHQGHTNLVSMELISTAWFLCRRTIVSHSNYRESGTRISRHINFCRFVPYQAFCCTAVIQSVGRKSKKNWVDTWNGGGVCAIQGSIRQCTVLVHPCYNAPTSRRLMQQRQQSELFWNSQATLSGSRWLSSVVSFVQQNANTVQLILSSWRYIYTFSLPTHIVTIHICAC